MDGWNHHYFVAKMENGALLRLCVGASDVGGLIDRWTNGLVGLVPLLS